MQSVPKANYCPFHNSQHCNNGEEANEELALGGLSILEFLHFLPVLPFNRFTSLSFTFVVPFLQHTTGNTTTDGIVEHTSGFESTFKNQEQIDM